MEKPNENKNINTRQGNQSKNQKNKTRYIFLFVLILFLFLAGGVLGWFLRPKLIAKESYSFKRVKTSKVPVTNSISFKSPTGIMNVEKDFFYLNVLVGPVDYNSDTEFTVLDLEEKKVIKEDPLDYLASIGPKSEIYEGRLITKKPNMFFEVGGSEHPVAKKVEAVVGPSKMENYEEALAETRKKLKR